MAFGDQLNDIEMLEQAYYSFAVGNARPEVKATARFQTDTNVNDGVLKILEGFCCRGLPVQRESDKAVLETYWTKRNEDRIYSYIGPPYRKGRRRVLHAGGTGCGIETDNGLRKKNGRQMPFF